MSSSLSRIEKEVKALSISNVVAIRSGMHDDVLTVWVSSFLTF